MLFNVPFNYQEVTAMGIIMEKVAAVIPPEIFDWIPAPPLISSAQELRLMHMTDECGQAMNFRNAEKHYPPDIAMRDLRAMLYAVLLRTCDSARRGWITSDARMALTKNGKLLSQLTSQLAIEHTDLAMLYRQKEYFYGRLRDDLIGRIVDEKRDLLIKEKAKSATLLRGTVTAENGELVLKVFAKPPVIK